MIRLQVVKYYAGNDIYFENRDPENRYPNKGHWTITQRGLCLNREGEFEYEPMPSNRDNDFLARCRFSFDEAKDIYIKYLY